MSAEIDEETREIIDCFLTEGREALEELEMLLVTFEEGAGTRSDAIDSMFRIFHSIKGSAGYLEFERVERVTHQAETILQGIRDGQQQLTRDLIDCFCLVIDFLNDRFEAIEATSTDDSGDDSTSGLVDRLRAFLPVPAEPDADPPSPPPAEVKKPMLGEVLSQKGLVDEAQLRDALNLRHRTLGRVLLDLELIDEAQLARAVATQEELTRDGDFDITLGDVLVQQGLIEEDILRDAVAEQERPLGEVLVELGALTHDELVHALTEQEEQAPPQLAQPEQAAAKKSSARSGPAHETLRVDVRKLNALMDLVGELIIASTSIIHNPELETLDIESFQKSAQRLGRVTRSLQDVAMSVRMVPIDGTFRKMHRLVRDVSRKQGKEVGLLISGQETEVDKKVAELIADPLVHLMRNAIDHGLETVEERRRAGKPPEGSVTLEARHQGGEIWISITDDGRGIDRSKVLAKARERRLPESGRDDLTDQQIYNFIFEPGFSTAIQLSDISGRGIGMDVVKKNIEKVKGRIDVTSTLGVGTTFTLRIPLTLAIIEGMLVRVGRSFFTLPLLQITESVVVEAADITTLSDGQEIARIRDQLIPIIRLHRFFSIPPDTTTLSEGILVVVEDGGETMSLFVDELIGQRQTVVKSLSGYLGSVSGLSGCTVLGDGRISLIIDVTSMMDCSIRSAA